MAARFTCDVPCAFCARKFKSFKVLSKHSRDRHNKDPNGRVRYLNNTGEEVSLCDPRVSLEEHRTETYKRWLATLSERIGEALHPELPGNLLKICFLYVSN